VGEGVTPSLAPYILGRKAQMIALFCRALFFGRPTLESEAFGRDERKPVMG
jgi:hypothetical protein